MSGMLALPPSSGSFGLTVDTDGKLIVSSRKIAEDFEKRHADVLRDIDQHLANADLRSLNWIRRSSYIDEQGKERPCFLLTRDGFMFVVQAYTTERAVQIKIRYIDAFNEMEARLKGQTPDDRWHDAMQALGDTVRGVVHEEIAPLNKKVDRLAENVVVIGRRVDEIVPRRDFSEHAQRQYVHIAKGPPYRGLCPCCFDIQILDADGRIIKGTAHFEHFYSKDRNKAEEGWLVCARCNLALQDPEFRRTHHARFETFQSLRKETFPFGQPSRK